MDKTHCPLLFFVQKAIDNENKNGKNTQNVQSQQ